MEEFPCLIIEGQKTLILPTSYKFHPTSVKILYYLKGKTLYPTVSTPNFLPEYDVSQAEPWMLPGLRLDSREMKFFLSRRKNFAYGNTCNMIAGSGYWKYIGESKSVVDDKRNNLMMGVRKALVFYEGKHSQGPNNTIWVMNEFCLVDTPKASHPSQIVVGDWAIYAIFQKMRSLKRKRSDDNEILSYGNKRQRLEETNEPNFKDFPIGNLTLGYDISLGSPTYDTPFFGDMEVEDLGSWDSDTDSAVSGSSCLSE